MTPYKLATIVKLKSGRWYIYYSCLNHATGKFVPFRDYGVKERLNRERDSKEKMSIARAMRDGMEPIRIKDLTFQNQTKN